VKGGPSGNSNNSANPPPDSWGKKYLAAEFPRNVCWEWGHWAPDCPRVKNGQPLLNNPPVKNPSWRPRKSGVLSNCLFTKQEELVSVSATPDNSKDTLCNTGATNHVTFHKSFFFNLRRTNICLCVASQEKLPVDGIGDAVIPTSHGNLHLSNVLLCRHIGGTVLLVVFFNQWDGCVTFKNGVFLFHQHSSVFPSYLLNYCWFLSACSLASTSPPHDSITPLDSMVASLSVSQLWHTCMGNS
jgi:hypothetical protein